MRGRSAERDRDGQRRGRVEAAASAGARSAATSTPARSRVVVRHRTRAPRQDLRATLRTSAARARWYRRRGRPSPAMSSTDRCQARAAERTGVDRRLVPDPARRRPRRAAGARRRSRRRPPRRARRRRTLAAAMSVAAVVERGSNAAVPAGSPAGGLRHRDRRRVRNRPPAPRRIPATPGAPDAARSIPRRSVRRPLRGEADRTRRRRQLVEVALGERPDRGSIAASA